MLKRFITLSVISAMAALLVWQYRAQYAVLENHHRHEKTAPDTQGEEAQHQCSAKALARFQILGLGSNATASHKGHFNAALGQCYMLIESANTQLDTDWKQITLYDGDGKVFASYGWHSEAGRKAADIPAYSCDVTLPSGEHRVCTTEADFRNLAGAYMQ